MFTSKNNGNTIFFPAAGNYSGTTLSNNNSYGSYLSSTIGTASNCLYLNFNNASINTARSNNRDGGRSIRGVIEGNGGGSDSGSSINCEFVDLGLPSGLKWAKRNIGAEKETDYGMYFKFGDVVGHGAQDCNHDGSTPAVEVDGNNHLLPAYDVATQIMGEGYRMPTKEEMDELISNTDHAVVTIDGVSGMRYSKKGDVNTYIFVPFAGGCFNRSFFEAGIASSLWSSTLEDKSFAYTLYYVNDGDTATGDNYRDCGFSVRAVTL